MSKKNARKNAESPYPIDPKTGRPKIQPQDRKPNQKNTSFEQKADLATRMSDLPVIGSVVRMLLRLHPVLQMALWLIITGIFGWLMVDLLVGRLPTIIGYTEDNIFVAFSFSVLIVAMAPIVISRNWHHMMRPVAVTALCWVVYPDVMPMVLFVGLIRIYIGEIASTSLWPAKYATSTQGAAKKRS